MVCKKCNRETDENCKSCPEYEKMKKEIEKIKIKIINENPLIYNYCNDEHTGEEFIKELAGYILDFGQGDCYGVRCSEYCELSCINAVTTVIMNDFKEGADHENN